jgi:DedD protein
MASSQDTEITLGTGKLLFLFFSLVIICALFFALGYSLGRKSESTITTASAAVAQPAPSGNSSKASSGAAPTQPMTFYKSVENKDANPGLTPPADGKSDAPGAATSGAGANAAAGSQAAASGESTATLPTGGYFVQVAAVTKQEDADSLVDALKKKEYPAVATQSPTDKLFRVQVGPYSDIKDAEAMRTRLIGDGYNPIVKK